VLALAIIAAFAVVAAIMPWPPVPAVAYYAVITLLRWHGRWTDWRAAKRAR
jgi:hypothetical protein